MQKRNIMRILFLLLITIALTSCTSKRKNIDFQQVLEEAQTRVDQAKSLSEDTLLVQALEHYQNLEPKDTIRLHRAIILTAYHYWWKDEKPEAYDLLETIANTDREALITLIDLTSRDNDFVACYEYLKPMIHDDSEDEIIVSAG